MNEKINTTQLGAMLATRLKMTRNMADTFVRAFIDTIAEGLTSDGVVKVRGLGTFKVASVAERESVSVTTGERITIPQFNKIIFIPETYLPVEETEPVVETEPAADLDGIISTPESLDDLQSQLAEALEQLETAKENVEKLQQQIAETIGTGSIGRKELSVKSEANVKREELSVESEANVKHQTSNLKPQSSKSNIKTSLRWVAYVIALLAIIALIVWLTTSRKKADNGIQTDNTEVVQPVDSANKSLVEEEPQPRIHVLQRGESLTILSVLYYDTKDSVPAIIKANDFKNPDNIPIGAEIIIP